MDVLDSAGFLLCDPPYVIPSQEEWPPVSNAVLEQFRKRHRLSTTAIAKLVGISDRTLRKWMLKDTPLPYAAWYVLLDKINRGEHRAYQTELANEDDRNCR